MWCKKEVRQRHGENCESRKEGEDAQNKNTQGAKKKKEEKKT
jgi:hypothetical protein